MLRESRQLAAEDRALGKSMLGNILAMLRRSHSPGASLSLIDDWIADLRVGAAPSESRSKHSSKPKAASSDPAAASEPASDVQARLAKLLRNRKRSQEYTRRLDAQIAALEGRVSSDQEQSDAPKTPVRAAPSPLHSSAPEFFPALPASYGPHDVSSEPPSRLEAATSDPTPHELLEVDDSARRHPPGPRTKLARRIDYGYPAFVKAPPIPPQTPSPSKGMVSRDATAFVRSHLANRASVAEVGNDGVAYLAKFLAMHVVEQWGEIMDTWGAGAIDAYARTGIWRH